MVLTMNDYIKRDELYNNLVLLAKYEIGERQQGILGCAETVRMCQAADVAPVVHGRWEWFDKDVGTPVIGYEREWGWRCSHCGEELPDNYDDPDCSPMLRFCFNCGAKMNEGDNDAKSM